ncbi:helix-turn-helix domain-containing protein [Nonomuraea sp. NPDC050478]|uniref:helix-turn-helix domain-containing protein n=1 Tax=Nonomuraea sp. NPDC050478 TaxID=3364365 RepID=UPI0037B7BC6E
MVALGRKKRCESRYFLQAVRLGSRLRELRVDRGYTQQQLADRAEVALSTLRKIESAAVIEPGYFTIFSLLQALEASWDEL